VLGAFEGAIRQIAHLAALGVGYVCARPLGRSFGPGLAQSLHLPLLFGVLAATILVFIVVMVAVRALLVRPVRTLILSLSPEPRRIDRVLGFALGALKVCLIAYLMISALSFVEDNVAWTGRRLGLSPRIRSASPWLENTICSSSSSTVRCATWFGLRVP